MKKHVFQLLLLLIVMTVFHENSHGASSDSLITKTVMLGKYEARVSRGFDEVRVTVRKNKKVLFNYEVDGLNKQLPKLKWKRNLFTQAVALTS